MKTERNLIVNRTFDEERALYSTRSADIRNCVFAGPADGESVLKESRDVNVSDSRFSLRYPLWHVRGFSLRNCDMDGQTRAALWYSEDGTVSGCTLGGVKAVRECRQIQIDRTRIVSPEFGWKSSRLTLEDCDMEGEYVFMDSRDVTLKNVRMRGKYSFQYMDGLIIENSVLDTKDAFWHSRNVVVRNSIVKGEYLAWYSEGLTLIGCTIVGTQPLCYCKNLRLEDCTMENCDLAFEYSDVRAEVRGRIDSVKNPKSGEIVCDGVGGVIRENPVMECSGVVRIRKYKCA